MGVKLLFRSLLSKFELSLKQIPPCFAVFLLQIVLACFTNLLLYKLSKLLLMTQLVKQARVCMCFNLVQQNPMANLQRGPCSNCSSGSSCSAGAPFEMACCRAHSQGWWYLLLAYLSSNDWQHFSKLSSPWPIACTTACSTCSLSLTGTRSRASDMFATFRDRLPIWGPSSPTKSSCKGEPSFCAISCSPVPIANRSVSTSPCKTFCLSSSKHEAAKAQQA